MQLMFYHPHLKRISSFSLDFIYGSALKFSTFVELRQKIKLAIAEIYKVSKQSSMNDKNLQK